MWKKTFNWLFKSDYGPLVFLGLGASIFLAVSFSLVIMLEPAPQNHDKSFPPVECDAPPETMGKIKRERCTLIELRRIADALERLAEER